MNRNALKTSVLTFALLGIAVSGIPFVNSMWPNEKQIGELPHVDISGLKDGYFLEAEGSLSQAFILKNTAGEMKVFAIPFWEGKYRMPDLSWRRAYLPCDNFGPDADGGHLLDNGKFKCFDKAEEREWWKTNLQWTFDGNSLDKQTEALMVPKFEIRGNTLILGKSK